MEWPKICWNKKTSFGTRSQYFFNGLLLSTALPNAALINPQAVTSSDRPIFNYSSDACRNVVDNFRFLCKPDFQIIHVKDLPIASKIFIISIGCGVRRQERLD
jgi:hypothetical protein